MKSSAQVWFSTGRQRLADASRYSARRTPGRVQLQPQFIRCMRCDSTAGPRRAVGHATSRKRHRGQRGTSSVSAEVSAASLSTSLITFSGARSREFETENAKPDRCTRPSVAQSVRLLNSDSAELRRLIPNCRGSFESSMPVRRTPTSIRRAFRRCSIDRSRSLCEDVSEAVRQCLRSGSFALR